MFFPFKPFRFLPVYRLFSDTYRGENQSLKEESDSLLGHGITDRIDKVVFKWAFLNPGPDNSRS